MAERDTGRTALVLGGAAAVAAAIALVNSGRARATPGQGPLVLDETTMQLLVAMAENGADISRLLQTILKVTETGEAGPITVQGYPDNADSIEAGRVVINALDTGVQFPDVVVPNGMALLVKGFPRNGNLLFIGKSQNASININQSYPLLPNENVRYYIKNASALWVAGITGFSNVNDSIVLTVEQKQEGG